MIIGDIYANCPIMDSEQCKANGPAYFWAPEDYYNFARAFLRNEALVDAFIKPEFR